MAVWLFGPYSLNKMSLVLTYHSTYDQYHKARWSRCTVSMYIRMDNLAIQVEIEKPFDPACKLQLYSDYNTT